MQFKLSDINKDLEEEGLKRVSRQQVLYLMNKTSKKARRPLVLEEHYSEDLRNVYTKYVFTDSGYRFIYEWAIKRHKKSMRVDGV